MPFTWKADTWYHLKLRVENMPDGKVRARGKAWPTGQPEPAAWTIEKIDPIGNHQGAPGFFVDAEFGAYLDNLKVSDKPMKKIFSLRARRSLPSSPTLARASRVSAPAIPAPATGRCGAARPTATWSRT